MCDSVLIACRSVHRLYIERGEWTGNGRTGLDLVRINFFFTYGIFEKKKGTNTFYMVHVTYQLIIPLLKFFKKL